MDMVITDMQILIMVVCSALSIIAYKLRIPGLAIIPAIGFFILAFQLYDSSGDPLILCLLFVLAIVQFTLCFDRR